MAQHESASAALSGAIGATREAGPRSPAMPSPTPPSARRPPSGANPTSLQRPVHREVSRPDRAPAAPRQAPPPTRATIGSPGPAPDLRYVKAGDAPLAGAAVPPSWPRPGQRPSSSDWTAASRRSATPSRSAAVQGGTTFSRSTRAWLMAGSFGVAVAATLGALKVGVRRVPALPVINETTAAAPARPQAKMRPPVADSMTALSASQRDQPPILATTAPDPTVAPDRRPVASSALSPQVRDLAALPDTPRERGAAMHSPRSRRGPAPSDAATSDAVVAAVAAAQAKADAFLGGTSQGLPEQAPADSSSSSPAPQPAGR